MGAEAAACPARGPRRPETRRTRRRRGNRPRTRGRAADGAEAVPREARAHQGLRFSRPGGRLPAAPLARPALRPGGAEGAGPGGCVPGAEAATLPQRPGDSSAALAPVGIRARRGRALASITADLPRPPCWEETTRHAAAKRQQRKRRRRRCQRRAAAEPGGRGRRPAGGTARAAALRRPGGASRVRLRGAVGVADVLRRRARRAAGSPGLPCGAGAAGSTSPGPAAPVSRSFWSGAERRSCLGWSHAGGVPTCRVPSKCQ
ncbi:uncharacterized protein LOC142449113 [Tenrec ecaudatus]|uniref:uncharacterized protein LOC142449113 n=1 Tax=Tenrec ecaudatus TaxID=94439 RepID=UPI003F593EF0